VSQLETCPHCTISLQGEPIPEKYLKDGSYGPWDGTPQFYSRRIGMEIPGQYDGVLFWECPDCGGRWHRWPEGDFRYRRAAPYVLDRRRP
jgi:hypothetical protein